MAANKKIALLVGGMGAEREVSLNTGKAFQKALDELKANYTVIDAGPDLPEQLSKLKPDVALLALHGKYAEDGTVQGLCEYMKIAYSGAGVMASALCMNKYFTKQILSFNKIPTAEFEFVNARTTNLETYTLQKLKGAVVVKPSREGSSVGISIVKDSKKQLAEALKIAAQFDKEILIEEFIAGHEVTVPILDEKALTPIEIVPKEEFYDYKRKYTAGATDYIMPPRLDPKVVEQLKIFALQAHKACQVRTYSRVDFRVSTDGQPFCMEINTLPGCTQTSLLPKAAAHEGISFAQVIKILIDKASCDYEGVR